VAILKDFSGLFYCYSKFFQQNLKYILILQKKVFIVNVLTEVLFSTVDFLAFNPLYKNEIG